MIVIVSDLGVSNEIRESPPYSFTLKTPEEDRAYYGPGPLIGMHTIAAVGGAAGADILAAIDVDIETPEMPVKLFAETAWIRRDDPAPPEEMRIFWAGMDEWLRIFGKFRNGRDIDLTGSTHLKLRSGNPAIVRISNNSTVTSVGPGTTFVIARYSRGTQNVELFVRVNVEVPKTGIMATPTSLDFGNQAVGTTSGLLRIILTNRAQDPITIYKLRVEEDFSETDDCTSAPLPAGGICTILVRFTPYRSGRHEGKIDLPNSFGQASAVLLSGNGK